MLDGFFCKILIVIGYVGCDWFWLDLIQAVSLTAKFKKPTSGSVFCFPANANTYADKGAQATQ
ncbi:MAG: hypothetical protein ACRC5D_02585, partial [Aeromonas allosaccharophila]